MSEKETDIKKDDVVKAEDYNKVVENANSLKVDKEKVEKELAELKESKEKETKEKEEEEKKVWEKEKMEKDKQIEELTKKAEEKDKVSKGIVKEPKKKDVSTDDAKKQLDEQIPDNDFDPNRVGSNLARYGHYKNPTTKKYTDEQLGMGLDLNRGASTMDPGRIPIDAKVNQKDLVLSK